MDKTKLENAMREKNITKNAMCKELGISRTAFYRKTNGLTEFNLSELQKMVNVLELNSMAIFFD